MTLNEIKKSDRPFLLPTDIAPVLQCDPHYIRLVARDNPERLGFPVIRIGNRTKIPRLPFIAFMGDGADCAPISGPAGAGTSGGKGEKHTGDVSRCHLITAETERQGENYVRRDDCLKDVV